MGTTLNRAAFEKLIQEDLDWLAKQPKSLERDHIWYLLQAASHVYYGPQVNPDGSISEFIPLSPEGLIECVKAGERKIPPPPPRPVLDRDKVYGPPNGFVVAVDPQDPTKGSRPATLFEEQRIRQDLFGKEG